MDSKVYMDVVKVSKSLMFREPFYGLLLISLNKQLNPNIPTAGVSKPNDNINLRLDINPEFWNGLPAHNKIAVLKHELLHIGFFHLNMAETYTDKKMFNIAADLEINQYISDEFKGEEWMGLEINKSPFKELNLEPKKGTKYYYEKIQEEVQNNPEGELGQMMEEGFGDSDEMGHGGWEEFDKLSEAEKKLVQKQIDHTLKEIAQELSRQGNGRGFIPGEMKDYIDSLFEEKEAVLDWKSYLRRFSGTSPKVETKKTRYKMNRRFSENPALKIKPRKRTLVAIDTSGSVSDKDLMEFFNEINHIYKTGTTVTVIECDTKIGRVYEYKGKQETYEVTGRGGTDFEPVMDYLNGHRREYNNLIYLTDGECSAPDNAPENTPILWVHCSSAYKINSDLPGSKIQIK